MRPVNLLPEEHRPLAPTGRRAGSSYLVVGLLALMLVAVVAYALTAKQVNSRKAETVRVEQEASAAEARAAALAPFASFRQIKETRVQSVTELARGRVDWERLTRELAHVMPAGASLTSVDASTLPSDTGSATATATGESAPLGPTVALAGCAKTQPVVARTIVRLRRLDRAEGVKLQQSGKGDAGAAAAGGDAAGGGACPADYYEFAVTVELTAPSAEPAEPGTGDAAPRLPTSLGGGP